MDQPSSVDPASRFTTRVEEYVRSRPGYPRAVVGVIAQVTGLTPAWIIADIGSGTGLSTLPFLDHGNVVYSVEPNRAMREAAESLLAGRAGFHSVAGRAEATTLGDHSIDLVVAGQAFHWFEPTATRAELGRILRPDGWVVLLWNTRRNDASPFMRAYENLLLEFGTDYARVRHDELAGDVLAAFFGRPLTRRVIPNEQTFDYASLRGRVASTSYVPAAGEPGHALMMERLSEIVSNCGRDGFVRMVYDLEVYCGRLAGAL